MDGYLLSDRWSPQPVLTYCQLDSKQSGTKPNLVAKILAAKIGNLWA